MEQIVSIASAIVVLATVAVLVQSRNTSSVVTAAGSSFTNAVRAAMGNVNG